MIGVCLLNFTFQHLIKNHTIIYKDGFFFCEDETFAITSSKVGFG
jgi:hypothetical protein